MLTVASNGGKNIPKRCILFTILLADPKVKEIFLASVMPNVDYCESGKHRNNVKFSFLLKKTPSKTVVMLRETYKKDVGIKTRVHEWFSRSFERMTNFRSKNNGVRRDE